MTSDGLVVARGAAAGLLIAAPAALGNVVLADQDPKPRALLNLTLLLLLVGFAVAGVVAAREAGHDAARHGTLAALVAFVPVEVIGILGRMDRGEGVSLPGIVFVGFLAAMAGSLGALLGARRPARRPPP